MNECQMKAYAKINLGLDVVRRLENGYHEVRMVMQTVDIFDELTLTRIPLDATGASKPQITVTADSGEIPTDENNLIYKAAKLMMEQYDIRESVRIHLQKNIPIAAGMAGGSTDAAATLKGINRLFDLSADRETLMKLGVKIGADVPYCILGGTALAEGIGEKLTPLPEAPEVFLLVAKPDINVSTKYVYEHLDAEGIVKHPDIDGMVRAIELGSLQGILERMDNVLESVTVKVHPVISTIKERMKELGAVGSLMSGSGPTVFGIFLEKESAENAYGKFLADDLAKQVFVTTFHNYL
ncbi:MAG: 4-(cytidine 5'-diphospho)-2-C-methyl-D-erythritol kinase [Lachnospiraceae bacterium]|nr:4-(cytidine 5'-diphospho)-2-C-methyl-D-erythritol kinase [Lachnospiraceae bacterium]